MSAFLKIRCAQKTLKRVFILMPNLGHSRQPCPCWRPCRRPCPWIPKFNSKFEKIRKRILIFSIFTSKPSYSFFLKINFQLIEMYIFIVKIVILVKIVLNNLMLVNDRQRLKYTGNFSNSLIHEIHNTIWFSRHFLKS